MTISQQQLTRLPSVLWWCLANPERTFRYETPFADTEALLRAACADQGVTYPENLVVNAARPYAGGDPQLTMEAANG